MLLDLRQEDMAQLCQNFGYFAFHVQEGIVAYSAENKPRIIISNTTQFFHEGGLGIGIFFFVLL